ncbi:MAG: sulfatase-like hydrolase/transferase [Solirubrobacteraceae bacterium]|nr:sulfatase-like hydrolase/transferase [Solirubrobacteraceae bacterium]
MGGREAAGGLRRRGLLGAALAGAAALAGLRPRWAGAVEDGAPGTGPLRTGERPNVLLVVLHGMRADAVGAYDGDGARTPNLDRLADRALRVARAIPEGLPAVPVRRALLTGMRTYPFRDWRAVEGIPAIPGWNPIWPHQPLLPEVLADGGVHVRIVSDDPLLGGDRLDPFLERTQPVPGLEGCDAGDDPCGACLPCLRAAEDEVPGYLVPLADGLRARPDPTARVLARAAERLEALRDRQPFFLMADVFDPADVARLPVAFVDGPADEGRDVYRPGRSALVRRVPVAVDDATAREVRRRYLAQQTENDAALGGLLDRLDELGLRERTLVWVLSDGAVALGEHGVWGHPQGVGMRAPYEVPYLIADPSGRRAGEHSEYLATTHDVAPTIIGRLGLRRPGRMNGEDLEALLDEEELPARTTFTTMVGTTIVAGHRDQDDDDDEFVLVADLDDQSRRVFDEDGDDETSGEGPRLDELWRAAIVAGGGTLPEFGEDAALRPPYPDDDHEDERDELKDDADAD